MVFWDHKCMSMKCKQNSFDKVDGQVSSGLLDDMHI